MNKFLAAVIATVFTLAALVTGIMLTNSVSISFTRMICYDLIFVGQFLTFLWCAVTFYPRQESQD